MVSTLKAMSEMIKGITQYDRNQPVYPSREQFVVKE